MAVHHNDKHHIILHYTLSRSELNHYCDVIMGANASQITNLAVVYSAVFSGADQRKHKSSASLAFVRGIHRRPVNSPHKWPVTRKMFPFDDVIMSFWFGTYSVVVRCWIDLGESLRSYSTRARTFVDLSWRSHGTTKYLYVNILQVSIQILHIWKLYFLTD